jgi:hypothetical protein
LRYQAALAKPQAGPDGSGEYVAPCQKLKVLTFKLYGFSVGAAPDGSAASLLHDSHNPGCLIFHKGAVADNCARQL